MDDLMERSMRETVAQALELLKQKRILLWQFIGTALSFAVLYIVLWLAGLTSLGLLEWIFVALGTLIAYAALIFTNSVTGWLCRASLSGEADYRVADAFRAVWRSAIPTLYGAVACLIVFWLLTLMACFPVVAGKAGEVVDIGQTLFAISTPVLVAIAIVQVLVLLLGVFILPPIIVIEEPRALEVFRRSATLLKGAVWRVVYRFSLVAIRAVLIGLPALTLLLLAALLINALTNLIDIDGGELKPRQPAAARSSVSSEAATPSGAAKAPPARSKGGLFALRDFDPLARFILGVWWAIILAAALAAPIAFQAISSFLIVLDERLEVEAGEEEAGPEEEEEEEAGQEEEEEDSEDEPDDEDAE